MRRAIIAACLAFAAPALASPLDAMVRDLEAGRDRLVALEASEGLCEDRPDCIAQWARAGLDHERVANHRRTIRACRAGSALDCAYVRAWNLRR